MQLNAILEQRATKSITGCTSKKRLFQDLGEVASTAYDLDSAQVIEALMDREALGPTGVGQGVALPHARIPGIDKVYGLFLRLDKPLPFESVDRQPVDIVFALIAPTDAGVEHLKALALVSRTLRDSDICAKLRANGDETALYAILTDGPSSQAA